MADLEQVRDKVYRAVDAWIDARRDRDTAEASGDLDEISAADEALYEAALAVAEPVLGDVLRDRMWREIAPLDLDDRNDWVRRGLMLEMLRKFLIDTMPLSVREVADPCIEAAWRTLVEPQR